LLLSNGILHGHSATTINENGISQVIDVLEAQEIKETGNEED